MAVLVAAGCGSGPDHVPEVVASNTSCDDQSEIELSRDLPCERAEIVGSGSNLPRALESWGYDDDAVVLTADLLLFLGMIESGSCPAEVRSVNVVDSSIAVETEPFADGNDCTDDASGRSFIIEITAEGPIESVTLNGADLPVVR